MAEMWQMPYLDTIWTQLTYFLKKVRTQSAILRTQNTPMRRLANAAFGAYSSSIPTLIGQFQVFCELSQNFFVQRDYFLNCVIRFADVKGRMKSKKKSRRINSYTKPKTVKQAMPFPFKRVRIDWIDIITEGGWGTDKEFKNMKLATPVSEGWLFSKDEDTVRIFAGYDVDDDGSIHFSERSVFPTSCVKKITKIH